jgi:hypothetical protein
VAYRSGPDLLEAGFTTNFAQADVHYAVPPGQQVIAVPYRRINGAWPYLAPGIDRDTAERLEKNGAVLVAEKGRMSYLQADPSGDTYPGYNPLPGPADWSLSVPGGVKADGKVSLLRVAVQPKDNRLWIDYATKPDQNGPGTATHLLASGFAQSPIVMRDGTPLAGPFRTIQTDGQIAYIIPLGSS